MPAGNYSGWLVVAFGFSAWTRWVRARAGARPAAWWLQLFLPLPAYLTLLFGLVPFIVLQQVFFGGPTGGFPTLLFTLALFALLAGWSIRTGQGHLPRPWLMPLLPRLLIHGYFLSAGILLGIFHQLPVLLVMSLGMLGIELLLGPATQRQRVRFRSTVPDVVRRRSSLG